MVRYFGPGGRLWSSWAAGGPSSAPATAARANPGGAQDASARARAAGPSLAAGRWSARCTLATALSSSRSSADGLTKAARWEAGTGVYGPHD